MLVNLIKTVAIRHVLRRMLEHVLRHMSYPDGMCCGICRGTCAKQTAYAGTCAATCTPNTQSGIMGRPVISSCEPIKNQTLLSLISLCM